MSVILGGSEANLIVSKTNISSTRISEMIALGRKARQAKLLIEVSQVITMVLAGELVVKK